MTFDPEEEQTKARAHSDLNDSEFCCYFPPAVDLNAKNWWTRSYTNEFVLSEH